MKSSYDGVEHYAAWQRGWIFVSILSVFLSVYGILEQNQTFVFGNIWLVVFYFLCRYLGPDQDQLSNTSGDNRMYRELGIFGLVFGLWWLLYAYLMFAIARLFGFAHPWYGAHRTWLTHSIVPGTVIRWVWFNIPIGSFILWTGWMPGIEYIIPYILGSFTAMAIGDAIHLKVDKIGVLQWLSLKKI